LEPSWIKLHVKSSVKFYSYKKGLVSKAHFEAGSLDLDKYISSQLSQNEDRHLARNYIGMLDDDTWVSLLCLSASILKSNELLSAPDKFPSNMELPTIKIGRLVVNKDYQRRGYGEATLLKAVSIFIDISKMAGVIGLTVDAKTNAVSFYKKYGFIELKQLATKPQTPMILYTTTLKAQRPRLFEAPV
jgi:predicted GNAT family N-acyltransferase